MKNKTIIKKGEERDMKAVQDFLTAKAVTGTGFVASETDRKMLQSFATWMLLNDRLK